MVTVESTREHLLRAGVEAFRIGGYAATGLGPLLRRAGVPKGSFYHFFPSKEAFAREVLAAYADAGHERRVAHLADASRPPLLRLRNYFEDLADGFAAALAAGRPMGGCLLGNLAQEVAPRHPELRDAIAAAFARWRHSLAAVLREAAARDELPQGLAGDDMAGFLIDAWEGALLAAKAHGTTAPLQRFIRIVFEQALRPPERRP